MITVKEAFELLPKDIRDNTREAYSYGNSGYLFISPEDNDDASDPFYLVTHNKLISELNPFDDLDGFNKALKSPIDWR